MRLFNLFHRKNNGPKPEKKCVSCGKVLNPEEIYRSRNNAKICKSCYLKAHPLGMPYTSSKNTSPSKVKMEYRPVAEIVGSLPPILSLDEIKERVFEKKPDVPPEEESPYPPIIHWRQNAPIRSLREMQRIFSGYDRMLTEFLLNQGIPAKGGSLEGINSMGKPDGYIGKEERNHNLIKLRKSEEAAIAFHVAGGWFAIPSTGIGLRYIIPSTDDRLMDYLGSMPGFIVLAAATDDKDIWILKGDGSVISSNFSWGFQPDSQEKASVYLFNVKDKIRELTSRYFTEDQIEKIKMKLLNLGRIVRISDGIVSLDYDTEEKVFFSVFTDGNYYHGYDVSYPVHRKEDIVSRLYSKNPNLLRVEAECMSGQLPLIELIDHLEDSGISNYAPPSDYGCGYDYI